MLAQSLDTQSAPAAILALSKAFADPLRLDVLRLLKNNSFGVMELCHITTTPQSGMSHHLKILTACGLLETKREGTSIFYRRAMLPQNGFLSDLTKTFLETLDQTPLPPELLKHRQGIYDDRGRQSADFFKRCAAQLKENQDLVASFEHYSGCVGDLIRNENLPQETRVIEIGAGESPLLSSLSEMFKSVLVVDNSDAMLAKTKEKVQREQLRNVRFLLQDYDTLSLDFPADLLVCNMVLHHLPAPAAFFQKAAQLVKPLGRLLLIDLCPHQQDWTRDICGDLWLGFEPEDLDLWAAASGFQRGQGAFLGLKNGFQLQLRIFTATSF
jgi:ubiquinone/menaquinone biosynthesis C-methylase UbiE/DNA-binding transcriptional ArsR family regulator|tara:strand:- start:21415 stop:22395 length:981 start_codon:yes stop_codon:yes gene_type:complete